jgi:hypothetical protein
VKATHAWRKNLPDRLCERGWDIIDLALTEAGIKRILPPLDVIDDRKPTCTKDKDSKDRRYHVHYDGEIIGTITPKDRFKRDYWTYEGQGIKGKYLTKKKCVAALVTAYNTKGKGCNG